MNARRKELISLGKHNPKGFWKEPQHKEKQIESSITDVQWLVYAKLLYERMNEKSTPPMIVSSTELFLIGDIEQGIKKLENGKVQDIDSMQA